MGHSIFRTLKDVTVYSARDNVYVPDDTRTCLPEECTEESTRRIIFDGSLAKRGSEHCRWHNYGTPFHVYVYGSVGKRGDHKVVAKKQVDERMTRRIPRPSRWFVPFGPSTHTKGNLSESIFLWSRLSILASSSSVLAESCVNLPINPLRPLVPGRRTIYSISFLSLFRTTQNTYFRTWNSKLFDKIYNSSTVSQFS